MKKLKPSNEDEMIYEFLKMEIFSERYTTKIHGVLKQLNIHKNVILNGDLTNEIENTQRKEILRYFRGYRNSELF